MVWPREPPAALFLRQFVFGARGGRHGKRRAARAATSSLAFANEDSFNCVIARESDPRTFAKCATAGVIDEDRRRAIRYTWKNRREFSEAT
jgi:hypothetical protein